MYQIGFSCALVLGHMYSNELGAMIILKQINKLFNKRVLKLVKHTKMPLKIFDGA